MIPHSTEAAVEVFKPSSLYSASIGILLLSKYQKLFFYFVCVYKLHSVLMKLRCHQLYTFSIAPHASLAAVDVYDATGLDSALIVILYLSKSQ
jgi:hypothetical protein